ncbi:MAG: ATP synthase F0 subunit B [Oligoflexales bacterium]|nr:ATP synthase F0 subunit B [Oligoflexales bacterium]
MSHTFNWMMSFWLPYLNFSIFLALLFFFSRKPLSSLLANVRRSYQDSADKAQSLNRDAKVKTEQVDLRLKNLDQEMNSLRDKVFAEAQEESERIAQDADKKARHMLQISVRMAEAEKLRNKVLLQEELLRSLKAATLLKLATDLNPKEQVFFLEKGLEDFRSLSQGGSIPT